MYSESLPNVSVIVPVYNDPQGLQTTVASLVKQTYPSDAHEIVVVDNDSTDETYSVGRELAHEHSQVTVLRETTVQSSYAARNTGIRNSDGSILAFVDADMTVGNDWLVRAITAMEAKDADYLACNVKVRLTESNNSIVESREWNTSVAADFDARSGFPVRSYVEERDFAPTCCLLVRRTVFEDVGLFDDRFTSSGDLEFGNRVGDSGRHLHFAPEVTMRHPPRRTVRSLARKAVRIGRGRCQQRLFYPDRYGSLRSDLLTPGLYLPVHPWHLRNGIPRWSRLSKRRKVAFYLLATLLNWMRTYGRLRETWSHLQLASFSRDNGASSR